MPTHNASLAVPELCHCAAALGTSGRHSVTKFQTQTCELTISVLYLCLDVLEMRRRREQH